MLAFRQVFYDDTEVAAADQRPWPHFDYRAVLRAGSCFEPGGTGRYRSEREKMMTDPNENEIAALQAASPVAGEYLDSLGKTDLAVLSQGEWMTLIEVIVSAFQDALAAAARTIRPEDVPY